METSAGLKSLIHGVSTDDRRLRNKKYLDEQTNIQTVEGSGLHKRPPTEVVAINTFDNYVNDGTHKSLIKSFTLGDNLYYFTLKYLVADTTLAPVIKVYDSTGTAETLDATSADYFANVVTLDDLDIQTQQDTVFVTNRKHVVTMMPDQRGTYKTSLIHVKQAPADSSDLTFTWTDPANTTVTSTITSGSAIATRGTNVVAANIADEINNRETLGHTVGITATVAGSVVAVTRSDSEYARVSVQDENSGNVLVAINGTLNDILDIPAYLTGTQILQIKPEKNSDRGIFYMLSEPIEDPSPPTPPVVDTTVTSGTLYYLGKKYTGLWKLLLTAQYGSNTPAVNLGGEVVKSIGIYTSSIASVIRVAADESTGFPAGSLSRLTVIDATSDAVIFDGQLDQVAAPLSGYKYQKTLPEITNLVHGRDYRIYFDKTFALATDLLNVSWSETSHPTEAYKLEAATMPHAITPTETGLTVEPVEWDDKSAGDNETNPNPEFTGSTIRTLAIFQNRLTAIEDRELETTETDNNRSWFRSTVTQLLDTHPVKMRSTSPDSASFHSAINHNRDLLLMSRKGQFKLAGEVALTPKTSGLPQTSSYVNNPLVLPVSIGKNVYFNFSYGNYSGYSKYKASKDEAKQDRADTITDHVKTYMPGTPNTILGDANLGMLYAIHDSEIYVCDYDARETTEEEKRYAWSRWNSLDGALNGTIEDATLVGNKLQLVVSSGTTQADILQLDITQDPTAAIRKRYLDYLNTGTSAANLVTLPTNYNYDSSLRVVYGDGETLAGVTIPHTHSGGVLTLPTDVPDATDVVYGYPYKASITPSTIYIRDESGLVNPRTHLSIISWSIFLTDSADVSASIVSNYYTIDDQYWSGLIATDFYTLTDTLANNTNEFYVGFGMESQLASLQVHSTGHLPMNITGIDWRGKYNSRGKRF